MKKLLVTLLLLIPSVALATPSSVDRVTDHIEPLIKTDFTRSQYFTATSTSVASTLPYASTTALSSSKLTSGSCVQAGTGGLLASASGPCTSGTVTAISVATANGFAGSSSGGATPALTLTTTVSGVLKGNGTAISAAANGTDYTLLTAKTCNAGDFVSAATAAGVLTCTTPAGTVYTGTFPITVSGSVISFGGLSTSTAAVIGNIPYFSGVNTFANVATTTATISSGLSYSGTFGALVGGVSGLLTCTTGTKTVFGCLAAADYNTFNNKIGTSSSLTNGQVLAAGPGGNTAYSVATSTPTVTSPITYSGTLGSFVGGTGGAFACATCLTANQTITLSGAVTGSGSTAITTAFGAAAASTVLANITGASAVPAFVATSSLFTGTVGQHAYFSGTGALVGTSTIFTTTGSAVGIGTLAPAAKFDVQGTSTASTGQIADFWKSDGTNVMRLLNDGTVGIASTTPWARFSVDSGSLAANVPSFAVGSSTRSDFAITQSGASIFGYTASVATLGGTVSPVLQVHGIGATGSFGVYRYTTVGAGGAILALSASRGALGKQGALQDGDGIGSLFFEASDGTSYVNNAGSIVAAIEGTVSTGITPTSLSLRTMNSAGVQQTPLFLDASGNVGIGTTSPQSFIGWGTSGGKLLDVGNGVGSNGIVFHGPSGLEAGFGNSSGAGGLFLDAAGNSTASNNYIAFRIEDSASQYTPTERLRIDSSGNVGVGSTTPWGRLSVDTTSLGTNVPSFAVGSSTRTDFVVTQGGVVGIGTATPGATAKLQVHNGTDANFWISGGAPTVSFFQSLNDAVSAYEPFQFNASKFDFEVGNVGIATSTPWRTLSVTGTVGFDGLTSSAGVQVGYLCLSSKKEVINDSVACLVSSGRYKQDVDTLAPANTLAEILALRPVSFTYKPDFNGALQKDPNYSGVQTGLIAEEVAKVDPRLVAVDTATSTFEGKTYGPGTPSSVKYDSVVPVLISAMQEQQREIEDLQAAIKELQP